MNIISSEKVNGNISENNQSVNIHVSFPLHTSQPDKQAAIPENLSYLGRPVFLFPNIKTSNTFTEHTLYDLLMGIKNGQWRHVCESVRSIGKLENKEVYSKRKAGLLNFTTSGTFKPTLKYNSDGEPTFFSWRDNKGLDKHNGVLIADIDDLSEKELVSLKQRLLLDPRTAFLFVSPSGIGFKVGIFFDGADIDNHAHGRCFERLEKYFNDAYNIQIDKSCKNSGRVCYVSYDPDLYINPAPLSFPVPEKETPKPPQIQAPVNVSSASFSDKEKLGRDGLNAAINIIHTSKKGNLHHIRIRAGRLAGGYIEGGMLDENTAIAELEAAVSANTTLDIKEAMKSVLDGIKFGKGCPFDADEKKAIQREWAKANAPKKDKTAPANTGKDGSKAAVASFPLSESGYADKFISGFEGRIRYCPAEKTFYQYDKETGVWGKDKELEVLKDGLYEFLKKEAAGMRAGGQFKNANRIESNGHNSSVYSLSQRSADKVLPSDFDKDDWAINCRNGILDLRTGELKPHDKTELHSKQSPAVYDSQADCPKFKAFLERVLPDTDVRKFVQRLTGYAMTGLNGLNGGEQIFVILHGSGANGKSVFLEIIRAIFDAYGVTTDFSTFTRERKGGEPTPELADLAGSRAVFAAESEKNSRLSEATIKAMTGGEYIQACRKYENPFSFRPQFVPILATNHLPKIIGRDHGIWRRVKKIPFDVKIPKAERDRALAQSIIDTELSGVLNWLIEGCLKWQKDGLKEPLAVQIATQEYKTLSDDFAAFFDDNCRIVENGKVGKKELFEIYKKWASVNEVNRLSRNDFNKSIAERGFQDKKTSRGWFWLGIELLTDNDKMFCQYDNSETEFCHTEKAIISMTSECMTIDDKKKESFILKNKREDEKENQDSQASQKKGSENFVINCHSDSKSYDSSILKHDKTAKSIVINDKTFCHFDTPPTENQTPVIPVKCQNCHYEADKECYENLSDTAEHGNPLEIAVKGCAGPYDDETGRPIN